MSFESVKDSEGRPLICYLKLKEGGAIPGHVLKIMPKTVLVRTNSGEIRTWRRSKLAYTLVPIENGWIKKGNKEDLGSEF